MFYLTVSRPRYRRRSIGKNKREKEWEGKGANRRARSWLLRRGERVIDDTCLSGRIVGVARGRRNPWNRSAPVAKARYRSDSTVRRTDRIASFNDFLASIFLLAFPRGLEKCSERGGDRLDRWSCCFVMDGKVSVGLIRIDVLFVWYFNNDLFAYYHWESMDISVEYADTSKWKGILSSNFRFFLDFSTKLSTCFEQSTNKYEVFRRELECSG